MFLLCLMFLNNVGLSILFINGLLIDYVFLYGGSRLSSGNDAGYFEDNAVTVACRGSFN